MSTIGIDSSWHANNAPRRKVTGSLTADYNGLTISASCTITQTQTATRLVII